MLRLCWFLVILKQLLMRPCILTNCVSAGFFAPIKKEWLGLYQNFFLPLVFVSISARSWWLLPPSCHRQPVVVALYSLVWAMLFSVYPRSVPTTRSPPAWPLKRISLVRRQSRDLVPKQGLKILRNPTLCFYLAIIHSLQVIWFNTMISVQIKGKTWESGGLLCH